MSYLVQVIKYDHEEVIKQIECGSLRKAKMVEAGMNRNLNHDEYFTNVIDTTELGEQNNG